MEYFEIYTNEQLRSLVMQYPWWSAARMEIVRRELQNVDLTARADVITSEGGEVALLTRLHPTSIISLQEVDIVRLTHLSSDDLIERFLKRDDYRIVAEDGTAEDLSQVEIEDDGDMVSEELAEIYLNQGLYDDAIDTYRKLSLLNSEKSIYFAELIAKIEKNKTK